MSTALDLPAPRSEGDAAFLLMAEDQLADLCPAIEAGAAYRQHSVFLAGSARTPAT